MYGNVFYSFTQVNLTLNMGINAWRWVVVSRQYKHSLLIWLSHCMINITAETIFIEVQFKNIFFLSCLNLYLISNDKISLLQFPESTESATQSSQGPKTLPLYCKADLNTAIIQRSFRWEWNASSSNGIHLHGVHHLLLASSKPPSSLGDTLTVTYET